MMPETRTRISRCPALLTMTVVLALCIVPVSAITFTDDTGAMITLDATAERIVSLSPANTEILTALGLLDRVVGITDVCDYPPEVQNKTRIGGYSSISIEKVAAARPDLIIASDLTPKETVSRLTEIGLPVIVVAPKNIDHVIQDIRLVGEITGTGPQAEELAANLSRRIAAAQLKSEPGFRPTVAHVVWYKPLYVSGNNTLQNDVISNAGGINVFADRSGWSTVSLEEFLLTNPDIIIVSGGGGMDSSEKDVILEEFMTNPQYVSLAAVKNHHVYAVNADTISRPGPRIADAAEEVSHIISAVGREHAVQMPGAGDAGKAKAPGFSEAVVFLALFGLCAATRK
ncbi:MAG: cobalamin-binding protein [Methanoregula sp.]|jgi:iron complex transport system substrate-binding protein|nr:cobalamin-binding protein [Methanoregula sp.]